MGLTWGQIKSLIDKEVQDDERIGAIDYIGEPYLDVTVHVRTKEVEIYGTHLSQESREG